MKTPITMEFPPPILWRQGPRNRSTGPKNRNRAPKELIWQPKNKFPRSSTNTYRSKNNIPTGSRKHTSKFPTFFVILNPKKIRLGPKNMYRSKKNVQVQKLYIPYKFII
jgi:hypothetical protein